MAKSTAKKTTKKKAAKPAAPAKKSAGKSTKKPTRKPAAAAAPKAAVAPAARAKPPREPKPKKIKSPLTAKEMREYRDLLVTKRNEILGDMDSMSQEALRNHDSANLSHMPLHMADVGSDNHDQELMLGLVESERQIVREINDALERIADKTYGVCQGTGKPIGKPRLAAKPWAKYCIEYARKMEANGGRR